MTERSVKLAARACAARSAAVTAAAAIMISTLPVALAQGAGLTGPVTTRQADDSASGAIRATSGQVARMEHLLRHGPVAQHAGSSAALPKLTRLSIGDKVDAALAFAQLRIDVSAVAKAGVSHIEAFATDPSGQQLLLANLDIGYPESKANATLGMTFNRLAAPGTWTLTEVDVYDEAGNITAVTGADLTKLGRNTFAVVNDGWGTDNVPPELHGGKILTPTASLADTSIVGIQVSLADAGSPTASGIATVYAEFCTLGQFQCMPLTATASYAGQSKIVLRPVGNISSAFTPPGTYYLCQVEIADFAGNYEMLTGTDFNGGTDFSELFPEGHTIEVTN